MTPERVKELLPVMTAYAEGKTIQSLFESDKWTDISHPHWFDNVKYRVKPEPKYGWIVITPSNYNKSGYSCYSSIFTTEKQAKEATHVSDGEKVIKILLDEADGEE